MSFYKDPNGALHCHVLGTRAAAFLFLDGSAVCFSRARGIGIHPLRMEDAVTLVADAIPSGISEVLAPTFFLRIYLLHQSPGTGLLTQPGGGCTYCAMRPSTKSVRGKKGGRLSKPRRPKVQVRHRTVYPGDTLTGWGTPPYNPRAG